AGFYSKPKEDETHLVCVSSEQGGLNWVAQGSNGCFYDPTDGSISNMWDPKEAGNSMGRYIFTGLWVVIS
ncbi:MAG: hypothetical protein GY908_10620, partial [Flavobacteriales bacterium]|nr:hypothetical protein [Flavobacteriales bacterium]